MKHLNLWLWTCVVAAPALGTQIQAIKIAGETSAEVSFVSDGILPSTPRMSVEENRVDLIFAGVALSPALIQQVDIPSPHALLQRISVSPVEGGGARVRLIVNGSIEKLRDRVKLQKNDGTISLVLTYPASATATLKLLQEEQSSIDTTKPATADSRGGFGWFRLFLILFLFAATGGGTWLFVKYAKKKTGWRGTRRHLIEMVASAPVGENKASVAIVRVGGEFVMVGVTSSQVNLITRLPKLESQYEEENSLERGSFKEAIEEEVRRASPSGLSV